ncbi:MAG: hypothetical protein CMM87_01915 [Rickettsiales bacterium]|nr:hypothetical protein [Rickettsiales bacterium]|tara:strand:+ start:17749 stop:18993 length:1245 start_codon:yes stop_codon:yes gene_type:complete
MNILKQFGLGALFLEDQKMKPQVIASCISMYTALLVFSASAVTLQKEILTKYNDLTPWFFLIMIGSGFSFVINMALPQILSEFSGTRVLSSLAFLGFVIFFFHFSLNNFTSLFVATLIIFILNLLTQATGVTVVNQLVKDSYLARFLGFNAFASNIALALGPFLSYYLVPYYSSTLNFAFLAAFGIVSVITFRVKNPLKKETVPLAPRKFSLKETFSSFAVFKRNKVFFIMIMASCVNMSSLGNLLFFWGPDYGMTADSGKILQTFFFVGATFFTLPFGFMADRFNLTKIFTLVLSMYSLCYIVLGFNYVFGYIDYIALFLIGGCAGSGVILNNSFIGKHLRNSVAKSTSAFYVSWILCSIVMTYVGSEIIEKFGAINLNRCLAIFNLVMLVLFLFFARKDEYLKNNVSTTQSK